MNKVKLTINNTLTGVERLDCAYTELDEAGRFLIVKIEQDDNTIVYKYFNTKYIFAFSTVESNA